MEKNAIAYGSLYLDEDEGWIVMKKQLKAIIQPNVKGLYFDIIGYPEDEEKANEIIKQTKEYIRSKWVGVEVHIAFSINSKIKDMPKN